jgi:hypothetical protein
MMAKMIDYTREQMEKPPLDRVEYNLVLLRDAVHLLARRVEALSGSECMGNVSLVPVQTARYTRIRDDEESSEKETG